MRSRGGAVGFGGHGVGVMVVKSANETLSIPVDLSSFLGTNIELNRNKFSARLPRQLLSREPKLDIGQKKPPSKIEQLPLRRFRDIPHAQTDGPLKLARD